jgi:hypothetical protein
LLLPRGRLPGRGSAWNWIGMKSMPAHSPSPDADTDRRLLLLHADDNVLVTRAPIAAGEPILVGGVVGSAISPVVKICANPEIYRRMHEDMDVDAGRILGGAAELAEVGQEIRDLVVSLGCGTRTCSEELGHQEFILTYKSFEPIGPACLPTSASGS